MPYGVTGGPATFQHVMNTVLAPLVRKCVVVFIDDILIYSKSWEAHLQHLREVFTLLQQHQFKVKLSKCAFAQQQVHYLGHIISGAGVATDPSKVKDIVNWPVPQCVKDVRAFLGLAGYYRKFVKNFWCHQQTLDSTFEKGSVICYDTRILHKTHVPVSDTRTPRILPDTYSVSIGLFRYFQIIKINRILMGYLWIHVRYLQTLTTPLNRFV